MGGRLREKIHRVLTTGTKQCPLTVFTTSVQLLVEFLEGFNTLTAAAVCLVRKGKEGKNERERRKRKKERECVKERKGEKGRE